MSGDAYREAGIRFLHQCKPAPENTVCNLTFATPMPINLDLDTDIFMLSSIPVFSEKIKNALAKMLPIQGFELVPAVIRFDKEEIEIENFWVANIYQEMFCFDRDLSKFKDEPITGAWEKIEKVVVDAKKLSEIPLENRLVIEAKESMRFQLYHHSIIEVIKSVNPKGLRTISLEEWDDCI